MFNSAASNNASCRILNNFVQIGSHASRTPLSITNFGRTGDYPYGGQIQKSGQDFAGAPPAKVKVRTRLGLCFESLGLGVRTGQRGCDDLKYESGQGLRGWLGFKQCEFTYRTMDHRLEYYQNRFYGRWQSRVGGFR
jgi:hypothetical protein